MDPGLSILPTAAPTPTSSWKTQVYGILGLAVVAAIIYAVQWYATNKALSGINLVTPNLATKPLDGKVSNIVSGAEIPPGVQDYGIQFWCYVSDWNQRFGQEKIILRRADPAAPTVFSPEITLAPNENTLNVKVAIHPSDSKASASEPAPANNSGGATGDSFTCSVENIPLQAWFAVSVTVFQRNLDIYLNGKLVKSCVLPGVPRTVAGDIEVGPGGGFSGMVCDLFSQAKMLRPEDAQAFQAADTVCRGLGGDPSAPSGGGLFGQNVKLGVFDRKGKAVKQFVF